MMCRIFTRLFLATQNFLITSTVFIFHNFYSCLFLVAGSGFPRQLEIFFIADKKTCKQPLCLAIFFGLAG